MNKKELVAKVSKSTGQTLKVTDEMVSAVFNEIEVAVASGDKFSMVGFGSFESVDRSERMGRNLKTGEECVVPAFKTVKFKVGSLFKDQVNGK